MRKNNFSHRSGLRILGVSALVAGTFLGASAAQASPLGQGDQAKARAAATSQDAATLIQQAVKAQASQPAVGLAKQGVSAAADALAKGPSALKIEPTAIPVYALSPGFVQGSSKEPGTLYYVAFSTNQGASKQTLFTAPDASGSWKAVNVASGDTERQMATLAKGGELLLEPQIGAWYSVSGQQVRALNDSAVESIGKAPISIAGYQHKVATAYGDKQPGSSYDKSGSAGGFDAKGRVDVQQSEVQPAAQAAETSAAPEASSVMQRVLMAAAGAGALGVLALVWLVARRRSSHS
ncbi:hypothetical protein [Arthrobacter sp. NPDC090010]|uniref:hypothetical protein n=1 Tax=Arthrobacter sp. NPDC090010 TaxID=3363942 RepID=UPI003823D39F